MFKPLSLSLLLLGSLSAAQLCFAEDYVRATDDPDNVKNKLFEKKNRVELNLPDIGMIINQPFIDTYLIHGGINYFRNEEWGYGIELAYGINQDTDERECLENFYNDPKEEVEAECGDGSELNNKSSNYGPAYMPIREIKYMISGNMVWNPVYGKQLFFLSATSYFDLFITMGGGLVFSDYYEQRTELNNGNNARASSYNETEGKLDGGARTDEADSYGEAGRPEPQAQTHPFINLGVGQKFHFAQRFHVKFEFRNMTLLATPGGFENLVGIWVGAGMRL